MPAPVPPEPVPATLDDVRSVVFLFSPDDARVVLLCRAAWKSFAPLRWTGIGGRLEGEEVYDPAIGALRELQEETGLTSADLSAWRFVADILDYGAEVRLVYFTAVFAGEQLPPCNEERSSGRPWPTIRAMTLSKIPAPRLTPSWHMICFVPRRRCPGTA